MASNAIPAASGDREKLRAERKLRLIEKSEAGSGYEFVPDGVYGFTYSPGSDGVPVFVQHTFQCFEVHKLGDSTFHFIGYMTEDDANALNAATEPVDLKLYPEPYEKAQRFVSVPKDRIFRTRPSSRDNGNFFPFTILPG